MKKNIIPIVLLLLLSACGTNSTAIAEENQALKQTISNLESSNEALQTELTNVKEKVSALEEENNTLKQTIEATNNSQASDESTSNAEVSQTLLHENDQFIIWFYGVTEKGIKFEVQNLTDDILTFQCDAVSINGISYTDFTMSDDVAPQSKGFIVAKMDTSEIENEISSVGLYLRTYTSHDYHTKKEVNITPIDIANQNHRLSRWFVLAL
jgi:regulator of replication initiation timing